ncbi:MAG: IS21 family transposase [Polyangiaceae bacterium]
MAEGKTVAAAAVAAGMSERSAYAWKQGALPSETKGPRTWRTRVDPFAAVWESDVVPLLAADCEGVLEATTVVGELRRRHGDTFGPGQLRTLQRRMHEWRALHGPGKEVMFEQQHPPGREGAFDFTDASELKVTICGQLFAHLLFQFILTFSKWRWVGLAFSETFEALVHGLQDALAAIGGAPPVWRSDNLSAATHQLPGSGRELNRRFAAVLEHYGASSTRIEPRKSHQNGVVEKAHDVLKSALRQALIVRGSRDFSSVDAYTEFVGGIRDQLNHGRATALLAEERQHLRPLPSTRLPEYSVYTAVVRAWSTIHFSNRTYSVPSRLIGSEVEIRQHPDVVEIWYRDKLTETMPRLRGEQHQRIDYRHVIWSLVRKPGAFARYRYREELFPSLVFRRAYDALRQARGERADVEYVRILHLAASTMQARVEEVLEQLLAGGERPDFVAVKALAAPEPSTLPEVHIPSPDLAVYDRLLAGGEA